MACGILVPWPGIEPVPPKVGAWSLNHWTTKEVQGHVIFIPWGQCTENRLNSDQYAYLQKDESPFFFQMQSNNLELFNAIKIIGSDFR